MSTSTIQRCFHADGFPTKKNQEFNQECQNLDLKMMMSGWPNEFQKELFYKMKNLLHLIMTK